MSKLASIQGFVEPSLFQQLLMGSLFDDLAIPHYKDQIRFLNGSQSMGYDKAGSALHHSVECLLDLQFCAGINGGRGFIQKQHRRQAKHHPGNAQQLPLALRKLVTGFRQNGIIAFRQTTDEAMGMGLLRSGNDLCLRCIRFSHGNVFTDRTSLQPVILQHHTHIFTQLSSIHFPGVYPVQTD